MVAPYPNRIPEGRNEGKEGSGKDREQEAAELKTKMWRSRTQSMIPLMPGVSTVGLTPRGPELFEKIFASARNTALILFFSLNDPVPHLSPQDLHHCRKVHRRMCAGCLQTLPLTTHILHSGASTNYVAAEHSGSILTNSGLKSDHPLGYQMPCRLS